MRTKNETSHQFESFIGCIKCYNYVIIFIVVARNYIPNSYTLLYIYKEYSPHKNENTNGHLCKHLLGEYHIVQSHTHSNCD